MYFLRIVLILTLVLTSHSGFCESTSNAQIDRFCKAYDQYVGSKANKADEKAEFTFGFQLRSFFSPSSFVNLQSLNIKPDGSNTYRLSRKRRKSILVLLSRNNISKRDKSNYRVTLKEAKRLSKEVQSYEIFKALESEYSLLGCKKIALLFPFELIKIDGYFDTLDNLQLLHDKIEAEKTIKLVSKKTRWFKEKGWRVKYLVNYQELYKELSVTDEAIVIAHADPKGNLYDSERTQIPESFFIAFNIDVHKLKKLLVFSCYSNQVIENYQFNTAKYDYYFVSPEEKYSAIFSDAIPLESFWIARKFGWEKHFHHRKIAKEKTCDIKISGYGKNHNFLDVYLNSRYIGSFHSSKEEVTITFNCKILDNKSNNNFLDIQNVRTAKGSSLEYDITSIKIFLNKEKETFFELEYETFNSIVNDTFLLSKANF